MNSRDSVDASTADETSMTVALRERAPNEPVVPSHRGER